MDKVQFWKNFTLGDELHIAGRFIYNGLRAFHEMDTLHYDDEVFEVLYHLSVGNERLLKVAVVLIEHLDTLDQTEFERSLITHTHHELLKRILAKHKVHIAGPHNDFLQMLSTFYKTRRYGRYGAGATLVDTNEKKTFREFFEKHLKVTLNSDAGFTVARNEPRLKKFLGKIVSKVVLQVYEIIHREATRLHIYTWELRADSKAEKIFGRKSFDFFDEDILYKELLLFFIHSEQKVGHVGFMKRMTPLEFDPGLEQEYLKCFSSEENKLRVLDELEAVFAEIAGKGERLRQLEVIGNPLVFFDDIVDEETEDCDESSATESE